ncbi:hypothetical protein COM81_29285 [Priestia megaterium]|uniref:hypothetical protein n=1 Tax=Priestia megaterium TaxID=1404 RepID=UPI000BEC650F|nr:hypothetical protein [Priestia megaterium]PEE73326.1 hypothetical protein COM81_29285 [Priestia megaterium]
MPNKEYPYYFIKLGTLYYVNVSYKDVKKKEIASYEFTHDESVVFPFDTESIVKQMADECGGHIIVKSLICI